MDDRLYYVESPDGQVLGPLSMIQILEGIAADAILESARICEVGQQAWISLSDVAYTREEEEAAAAAESAPEPEMPEQLPSEEPTVTPATREPEEPPAPAVEAALTASPGEEPEPAEETIPPQPEPVPEGASDFAIDMQVEEEQRVAEEKPKPRQKRTWLIPTLVGVALPAIVGIYLVAGGKLPLLSEDEEPLPGEQPPVTATAPPTAREAAPPTQSSPIDQGWAHLATGDLQLAVPAFRTALEENPNEARAYHGLGLVALRRENSELAIERLQKALELEPDSAEISLALAEAYLVAGEAARAEVAAQRALLRDAALSRAHLVTGQARLAQGNSAGALTELTAYIEAAPLDTAARRELALTLAANGRLEAAVTEMNRYLEAYPDDREALLTRVEWMISSGNEAQAILVHKTLAEQYAESPLHQYLAGIAHGETEEGIHYLRRAAQLDTRYADAYTALGRCLSTLGRLEEAALAFEKAAAIRSLTPAEQLRYSSVLTRMQASETVAAAQESAPPPAPDPFDEFLEKIRSTLDRGDYDIARGQVYESRAKFKGNAELTRNLELWAAIVEYEAGNFAEALAILEQLDPGQSFAASGWGEGCVANWKARVHLAKGDYRAVIRSLDRVGSEDLEEYATARLWEGVALSSLGMQDLATRTWNQIPFDVPQSVGPSGRAARITARFLAGSVTEKQYRTAVAAIPAFENDMHFFLGHAALMAENSEKARTHLESAIASSRGHEFPYHAARFGIREVLTTGPGR